MLMAVAKRVAAMREAAADSGQPPPSTAEYLDAVRACLQYSVSPDDDSPMWKAIDSAVLAKRAPGTGTA